MCRNIINVNICNFMGLLYILFNIKLQLKTKVNLRVKNFIESIHNQITLELF